MDIVSFIGIVGATIILLTFLLNQFGKCSTGSLSYDIANAIGSLILIIYAVCLHSVPFIILNAVWFAVSLRDVIRFYFKKQKTRQ